MANEIDWDKGVITPPSAASEGDVIDWDAGEIKPPSVGSTTPGLVRSAGDSAIALGAGAVQGVKMLTDVAGAGNAASRALGSAADALTDLESPHRKAQKQERAAKIKTAEQSGSTWEEVKAHVGAFADAPIDTTLNAFGTSLPTLAAAAIPGLGQAAMRENAAIQREGMQQAGSTARAQMMEVGQNNRFGQTHGLAQQKFGMEQETQGIQNRDASLISAMRAQIAQEKDPAKRQSIVQRMREMQGQAQPSEWGVQVTPTTKNVDGSTSMGSIVRYNKATGQTEVVQQPGQGGAAMPPGMIKQVGTSGGKPVYEDASGKRFLAG